MVREELMALFAWQWLPILKKHDVVPLWQLQYTAVNDAGHDQNDTVMNTNQFSDSS